MKTNIMQNFYKIINKFFIIFILVFLSFSFTKESYARSYNKKRLKSRITCSVCHKNILNGERYLKANNKYYCSKKCYNSSLPNCSICGKKMPKWITAKGKKYCSEACLEKTLPQCHICHKPCKEGFRIKDWEYGSIFFCKNCVKKPKCFSCQLPGATFELKDGRMICKRCDKTAINDKKEARKIYQKVKLLLKEHFNIPTNAKIKVDLIDVKTMHNLSTKNQRTHNTTTPEVNLELGLYFVNKIYKDTTRTKFSFTKGFYEETTTKLTHEAYNIYALYGTPYNKLIEVFAHELAHDYFYNKFPNIHDLKTKEGFSEYISSLVNSYYKLKRCNIRMQNNPDPIYGGGYRMIKKIADKNGGLDGVIEKLTELNKQQQK